MADNYTELAMLVSSEIRIVDQAECASRATAPPKQAPGRVTDGPPARRGGTSRLRECRSPRSRRMTLRPSLENWVRLAKSDQDHAAQSARGRHVRRRIPRLSQGQVDCLGPPAGSRDRGASRSCCRTCAALPFPRVTCPPCPPALAALRQ